MAKKVLSPTGQANRLAAIREDVFAVAKMIQDNESLLLTAMLAEPEASSEFHQLAADLFNLVEVMINDERIKARDTLKGMKDR